MTGVTMRPDLLRPDCSRCVGLCCVALAFDRSAFFAFDKPAGEPCRNLDADHACTIHARLGAEGFRGCMQFDCLGAGQRATALFPDPGHTSELFDAFARMRRVHQLLELLVEAERLDLDADQRRHCGRLVARLSADWSREAFAALDLEALSGEVMGFLTGLRALAQGR